MLRSSFTPIQPSTTPMMTPAVSSKATVARKPSTPPSASPPAASRLSSATSSTVGASFSPDSASRVERTRDGSGTLRSTEKTAAESVGEQTAPSRAASHGSRPSTKVPKAHITPTLTPMPTVASNPATGIEPRISTQRVVNPPSARISTRAANPSEWPSPASLKEGKTLDSSMAIPRPRKSSSEGSPSRAPIREEMMATSTTAEPISSHVSSSIRYHLPRWHRSFHRSPRYAAR